MAKAKYYVVWLGHVPGVYTDWAAAKRQVDAYKGAKFKSFKDRAQAEAAFRNGFAGYIKQATGSPSGTSLHLRPRQTTTPGSSEKIISKSISVDAACSGNPGRMEYQGVTTVGKNQLFHRAFDLGTNNIGEFLALVHALAFLKKQGQPDLPIYTDSKIAMGWIKKKKAKTTLTRNKKTEELYQLMERGEQWLRENEVTNPIVKWKTKVWGEIPADFGRK